VDAVRPGGPPRRHLLARGGPLRALTGELPVGAFEPPSRKVHVDVRLDAIVLRALGRTPELRYQSAGEMRAQLETVAHDPRPANPGPGPRRRDRPGSTRAGASSAPRSSSPPSTAGSPSTAARGGCCSTTAG
jgi:hypothetical protein